MVFCCPIMFLKLKQVIIVALVLFTSFQVKAQTDWPTPEVKDMYDQARDFLSKGYLQQAIITYQHAIQLAPDKLVLYRDLGKAYYLSGNYKDAQATLEPILKSNEADDQTYQVMASCLKAENDTKKAKTILERGIAHFPHSGILYHDLGKIYDDGNEEVYALQTWLDGIEKDPAYHVNYYEAARTYMNTDKIVWAIIYGEIFVNIEQQTPRSNETRKMLVDAYTKLFYNISTGNVPKFGQVKSLDEAHSFEEAVKNTLLKLSPIISDGINTENLIMVRTRFLMDWYAQYADRYPFTLFTYQDNMLRNGFFDIYNEWLFAKAQNEQEYTAWNKFHEGAMTQFEAWKAQHPFKPVADDFYNNKKVEDIFTKPKKKKE